FVGKPSPGILRRLNICYRTFSLKHNEENK
ncbi:hypothetical protein LTSEMIN_2067, partial [Salmonella enterica subsp. enterica serovar Minnesota str. A4-603]